MVIKLFSNKFKNLSFVKFPDNYIGNRQEVDGEQEVVRVQTPWSVTE